MFHLLIRRLGIGNTTSAIERFRRNDELEPFACYALSALVEEREGCL